MHDYALQGIIMYCVLLWISIPYYSLLLTAVHHRAMLCNFANYHTLCIAMHYASPSKILHYNALQYITMHYYAL